jgi:phytanoyl-CoA hydroxylase
MSYLSQSQVDHFHRDGFLVIPAYLNNDEISAAQSRIAEIIDKFDMSEVSVFSTTEQTKTSDEYFIKSGDKIRCFFEEEAFDEQGSLKNTKEFSINKVGHALHDLDEVFRNISYRSELASICEQIGMKDPLMVQSQYIFKQPGIGGKVVAHQDSSFIYTDPPSCIGFWMAMEDATVENGCLMAIPGSQRSGLEAGRFIRNPEGTSTRFIDTTKTEWDLTKMVPLEADKGSLVILHGSLVHMSMPNRSTKSRHAYIIHMVESNAHWPAENWLQRPAELPFKHLLHEV